MDVAMIFPGQGSQSQGMQADLADEFEVVRATWAEAGEILGYDLWQLVQEGPAEKLAETVVTQPAMLTAGVAAWRAWHAAGGVDPARAAGHSLGEYSALVCAGALDFADALRVVKRRAELMQSAVPVGTGAMAAILGLDDEQVVAVCAAAANGEVVEAVNFNAPGQVVIAGHAAAVERAIAAASEAGARRALPLPVSVPAHSALMRGAGDALREALDATPVRPPSIPVTSASDARPYGDADDIRARLSRQVSSPVQWVRTIGALTASGPTRLVESGPGKVLAGLAKRIDRSLPCATLDGGDALRAALAN